MPILAIEPRKLDRRDDAKSIMTTYDDFITNKLQYSGMSGFDDLWIPDFLFDFQRNLVEWACRKGRAAIFADCGMGKTPMQLVWAQNVIRQTNQPVLILAPLAASAQTVREADKFSIECERSRDGTHRAGARVIITNYERLHLFNPHDYAGAVCDESSILKNFDGVTKAAVTEFMRRMRFRLLCTATAAPNDYIELGTSSEALGELGYTDMLTRFFKNDESSIEPMAYSSKWRFKPHAERPFWRWLCSWARAVRKPSDLGFADGPFVLPELQTHIQTISASRPLDGRLFVVPAQNLQEQREERRATITERCEAVAAHAVGSEPFVAWCHLNDEGDLLERLIPDARQVSGADSDDVKEELFEAFTMGHLRALVTKPKIGAFGMNWQHCARMSFFPSHSYEQYYQAVRRCWRFGQTRPVTVNVVASAGEADVLGNLQRKADAATKMFAAMVEEMRNELSVSRKTYAPPSVTLPRWLEAR
jgi:hypothetical protein